MSPTVPATNAITCVIVREQLAVAELLTRLLARELPTAQTSIVASGADLPPALIPTLAFVRASEFHRRGFAEMGVLHHQAPAAAIVVTSSSLSDADAGYACACGARAILHKPFGRAELQAVMRQLSLTGELGDRRAPRKPPDRGSRCWSNGSV